MQNTNIKLSIGSYLGIIITLVIFIAIFFRDDIFNIILEYTGNTQIEESQHATEEMTKIILDLEKIKFDTSVLKSPYLESLVIFLVFPIDAETLANFGKTNPFIGTFSVVSSKATTSAVGGVVYSAQRAANNGASVIPVSPNRR